MLTATSSRAISPKPSATAPGTANFILDIILRFVVFALSKRVVHAKVFNLHLAPTHEVGSPQFVSFN
jgi:hypothetical protein